LPGKVDSWTSVSFDFWLKQNVTGMCYKYEKS
jgi:hypothetical protein